MKHFLLIIFINICLQLKAQPNAEFSLSRYKICSGSTVQLINSSSGANQFSWFIDGLHFSSAIDTQALFTEPCYKLIPVTLIAEDSLTGLRDSVTQFAEVFDTCFFHWNATILVCPGDTIRRTAQPEAMNVLWTVTPSQNYISGCDTCNYIEFIASNHMTIDLMNVYQGSCHDITSYEYTINCTTQLDEETENNGIAIFNSYDREKLHIHLPELFNNAFLQIFDLHGRKLQESELKNSINTIKYNFQNRGILLIRVSYGHNLTFTMKLWR
ncbi:MAG: hypothetical protein DWQ44_09215 [Bacteroidetes bacterium]|nr:MAG: hypothetical protein DWQ33_02560 [Bacteroidota bacterium]REK06466.1 MAG: hypothetical protein DWQ39_03005 [Bacteroidota bacterium]REK33232.1 MAG: hypothetical protein DWQ44_09215 [Bacteroidota bacterium]REK47069.1 MAG: hypothetical protein DWQ48_13550 [Bacteroidota bacterium]